jgi:uncharacterized protein (DUF2147 family)
MPLQTLIAALALASGPAADSALLGRWWNSDGTVAVDVGHCGALLCGRVVRADQHQQEKARRAGVANMVGLDVMRNFQAVSGTRWKGTVFVPARNRAFRSTITRLNDREVSVEGCLLLFVCQHETWRRTRRSG